MEIQRHNTNVDTQCSGECELEQMQTNKDKYKDDIQECRHLIWRDEAIYLYLKRKYDPIPNFE